jgi:hypothetical protein
MNDYMVIESEGSVPKCEGYHSYRYKRKKVMGTMCQVRFEYSVESCNRHRLSGPHHHNDEDEFVSAGVLLASGCHGSSLSRPVGLASRRPVLAAPTPSSCLSVSASSSTAPLRVEPTSPSTRSISNVASAASLSRRPNDPRAQPDVAGMSAGEPSTWNASRICSARSMAWRRVALTWALRT